MKNYKVLTVFNYDTFMYCFDDLKSLFIFINSICNDDYCFYIETKWLSSEMIKELGISYIRKTD